MKTIKRNLRLIILIIGMTLFLTGVISGLFGTLIPERWIPLFLLFGDWAILTRMYLGPIIRSYEMKFYN